MLALILSWGTKSTDICMYLGQPRIVATQRICSHMHHQYIRRQHHLPNLLQQLLYVRNGGYNQSQSEKVIVLVTINLCCYYY
jgi:hypothetical protein